MKTFLVASMFVITCSTTVAVDIGKVSENKGTACEIARNKTKMSGTKGAGIESMDVYSTQACVSTLTFTDDTKVKVNENSRLVIDDFVFDPKKSDAGKLALKVGMGTVRYASGQIAKNNPQQVAIQTPTAAISVRGTDFSMTVDETGQSLIVLLPSCKDEKDVKTYELEEQRCKVGQIVVTTQAGSVTLDQAFFATYVTSSTNAPTSPVHTNLIENKISNNLIIVRPLEVQQALNVQQGKLRREKEMEEAEQDQIRRMNERVANENKELEQARLLALQDYLADKSCNPRTNICVNWDRPEVEMQSRGKGIAFRYQDNEHYSEVKTQGYVSNTIITITQNDMPATEIIGDGGVGGNMIRITQNSGVLRKK